MSWEKREVEQNLVILGEAEGNAAKASGLLAAITQDRRYPDNKRYELVQKDGTSKSLAGSAAINSQLGPADVGKFVKLTFAGWGSGGNGRFKKIDVEVFEGEPTPAMREWPRWAELHTKKPAAPSTPAAPAGAENEWTDLDDDDSLPF